MDIRLVRIDDRLVHGQVATVWARSSKIQRILVVSDQVAKDTMRKSLLVQAAPPGVVIHVIPVAKMIEVYANPRFKQVKVMILCTNPIDVVRMVKGGVVIETVNIGGMSFVNGKRMITNAVAVNKEDIKAFTYLDQKGIQLEIRKVVTDTQVQLMDLLKKEKFLD